MNLDGTAQLTFVLGRLLGQNVTLERLAPLDGTATTNHKALGGAFFGFHFRHEITRLIYVCGWPALEAGWHLYDPKQALIFFFVRCQNRSKQGKSP